MDDRGFTTLEAVISLSLLVTVLASLGQAVFNAAQATTRASARSTAMMLAVDKMEQLRALMWTVNAAGVPVGDPGLALSPPDALDRDVAGYVDSPPGYVRRWAIRPLAGGADALVLIVRVSARSGRGEARLATIRARRGN